MRRPRNPARRRAAGNASSSSSAGESSRQSHQNPPPEQEPPLDPLDDELTEAQEREVEGLIQMFQSGLMPRQMLQLMADAVGYNLDAFQAPPPRPFATIDPLLVPETLVVLHTILDGDNSSLENLSCYPQNKVGDLFLFSAVPREDRDRYFRFISTPLPTGALRNTAVKNKSTTFKFFSFYILYLMHASLRAVASEEPNIPEFMLDLFEMDINDFKLSAIGSTPIIGDIKLPGVLDDWENKMSQFPPDVRADIGNGLAGYEFFKIVRLLAPVLRNVPNVPANMSVFYKQGVLDRAPYISFHPHHERNPIGSPNVYKKVLARLGQWFRSSKSDDDLQQLFVQNPDLFTEEIKQILLADPESFEGDYPTLNAVKAAIAPEFCWDKLNEYDD